MEEHIGRYDSGIDASTLTYDMSYMTLNSLDSSFSSTDVLNRARIDSIDDDPSIKDDLNEARILSQDTTLDNTGLLCLGDGTFNEAHINFSITLTNTPINNKENIYNNRPVKSLSVADVENVQRSQGGRKANPKNKVSQADRARKAKPLSPSKDIQNSSAHPNHICNGPKKGSYRKQTACKAKVSPPKSRKKTHKDYCQSQCNSTPKKYKRLSLEAQNKAATLKNNFPNSTKLNQKFVKSKLNRECTLFYKDEQYDSLEESETSVYVTPLQTPSQLHTETFSPCPRLSREVILNSPNITVRSQSPYNALSPNITVRSNRQTDSPMSAVNSSNDVDRLDYPLPHPHHSKAYFSPILDDSAIVEASCSGRKYRSPPKYLNLGTGLEADHQADNTWYKKGSVKHLLTDVKDQDYTTVFDQSPLANMLESLFQHSGSSYLQLPKFESIDHTYAEFQSFLRKLEGTNNICKKLVYDEHSPPKSGLVLSPLCCDSRPPDQLSEAELDEITWIHTTCNGQQVAPRVMIGQSVEEFAVFPPPRTPRHLKWNDHLEHDCDSVEKQKRNFNTPLKPILRKRPENHVFPYNGDNPSPYIITKTRQINSSV